ncbi:hypothetical protein [Virgisporangium ochraceum]|nr:hypothetical protein [Virgisporangium ochraceum]
MAGNVGTGLFGVVGAVVALATVRPWGMRIPVWLLAVPMWVGAGLLAPFVVLMPAAVVLAPPDSPDAELQPWVFVVVYGSFIVLGVGLTVALPLYARARLGVVVRGTVGQAPKGVTHAAQVALAWVFGAAVGLGAGVARRRRHGGRRLPGHADDPVRRPLGARRPDLPRPRHHHVPDGLRGCGDQRGGAGAAARASGGSVASGR